MIKKEDCQIKIAYHLPKPSLKAMASVVLLIIFLLSGCGRNFDPKKTYSTAELKSDFELMKNALVEAHPGVYRYTSPDSMRWIFDKVAAQLNHDMNEREFRAIVNPVFSYIRCGHTDIYQSRGYGRYVKKNKPNEFPLGTAFLENKLRIDRNRSKDTTLKIGQEIVAIDGKPIADIIAEMRETISSDGYNQTYKNTLINNNFGSYYRYIRLNPDTFKITVKDSVGSITTHTLTYLKPPKPTKKPDSTVTKSKPTIPIPTTPPAPKLSKAAQRHTFKISEKDSTLAILDLNTFSDQTYRRFYRQSFKKIKQNGIKNLVIDLRNNGGGRSAASIRLMSYLLDSAFVVYDSIVAYGSVPSFNKHLDTKLFRFMSRNFWSKKLPNGQLLNKETAKVHKPTKQYHFGGTTYVLTNGGSFSASAIFASITQLNSKRVFVVGRETGGGRYGCNAFISPYLTLPNTQARVRMPMFKILLHVPGRDIGRGVIPNYSVDYTFRDTQKGIDLDVVKVMELVKK
jgi:C-terminal processing protease CtpA/Prc